MKFETIVGSAVLLSDMLASPAEAREDHQVWATASASVKLSDQWRLSQDWVARFSDNRGGLYEPEVATWMGYKFGKSVTLAAGYAHVPQYVSGDFAVLERRATWQPAHFF